MSPDPETRCGELLEHRDRPVVCCHHPVLADDALDRVQLPLPVFARRVGRDVDVAAVIVEDGPLVRLREIVLRLSIEPELLGDITGADLRAAMQVDPQQLRCTEPPRTVGQGLETLDLVAVEQDRVGRMTLSLLTHDVHCTRTQIGRSAGAIGRVGLRPLV